ncbi:MAG: substrate-binding domain-containing protein [Myxococcales bacterium]
MAKPPNRVRDQRNARGFSQAALAAAVGLSRQSIHAIESGRAVPAVDVALRLAHCLACPVEQLFGQAPDEARLSTEAVGEPVPGRVALAHIAGRWLSYSLARDSSARAADALADVDARARTRVDVDLLRPVQDSRQNIVLMGCAPALGLLADRLNANAGAGRFLWLTRSSTSSLQALARRHSHLAGVHLVDGKTGEANVPDVRRLSAKRALVVITLASWEAGLVVPNGNPKAISKVAQLARKGLRFASREQGSGARRLLERELEHAGLDKSFAQRAAVEARGHVEVAQSVALGAADVGIATRDAALSFGLGFVPLAEERYDLVVGREDLNDPRLSRLFDAMTSGPFRSELSSLGYDVGHCGARVAEILAA